MFWFCIGGGSIEWRVVQAFFMLIHPSSIHPNMQWMDAG